MTMKTAKDCFSENIRLTGGAHADPVSFNLYNGLQNLAQAVERDIANLESQLAQIKRAVDDIQGVVRGLR